MSDSLLTTVRRAVLQSPEWQTLSQVCNEVVITFVSVCSFLRPQALDAVVRDRLAGGELFGNMSMTEQTRVLDAAVCASQTKPNPPIDVFSLYFAVVGVGQLAHATEQPLFAAFVQNAGHHLDDALATALHREHGGGIDADALRTLLLTSMTKLLDTWPVLHPRLRVCLNTKMTPALRAVCWTALLQCSLATNACVCHHVFSIQRSL
jgi:hypothetical protein